MQKLAAGFGAFDPANGLKAPWQGDTIPSARN
jgi:hypothetical protein